MLLSRRLEDARALIRCAAALSLTLGLTACGGGSISTAADAGPGGGSGGGFAGGSGGGAGGGFAGGSGGGAAGGFAGGSGGGSAGGSGGGAAGGSAGGSGGGVAGGSGGGVAGGSGGGVAGGAGGGSSASNGPYVFVIAMENQDNTNFIGGGVYGNSNAPYINNTLKATYGSASNYADCLPALDPSEPHYVWMEAGTNAFSDATFTTDNDPSASNSTSDSNHIAAQLKAAANGKTWRSYQEGLDSSTGACPISSSGLYAAKHDPFVFFQDVSGSPPSATNSDCAAHHRAFTTQDFQADLAAGDVAAYTFITPNLCNDMHGNAACTNGCTSTVGLTGNACIAGGDAWLKSNVPAILAFLQTHSGVLLVIWDEPAINTTTPFLIAGPYVKPGYSSGVPYTHSSYVKTVEEILGLPVNSRVSSANDFADFFEAGHFP